METGAHYYRHVARSIWRDPNIIYLGHIKLYSSILHSLVDSFENLEVVYTVLLKNMLDIMTTSYNELFCIDIEESYVE